MIYGHRGFADQLIKVISDDLGAIRDKANLRRVAKPHGCDLSGRIGPDPHQYGQLRKLFVTGHGNSFALRAVDFDPSAFDKASFYVASFVMPLCVPREYLTLTFGHRVRQHGKTDGWSMTMDNLAEELLRDIQAQAAPYLARADTFLSAAEVISAFTNPHAPKARAFLLARAGERERAIALIDDYLPKLHLDSHWEKEIFDISVRLRDMLIADPEAAHRQLLEWEDYTIQKLRLEAFR